MTEPKRLKHVSKFLSLLLRHSPETIGIELDAHGWVDIAQLLRKATAHGEPISRAELDEVVATSDKQRFAVSDDGLRIRANQGHSIAEVDLGLPPAVPPDVLYHGTAERFLDGIRAEGLKPRERNHVHLSTDASTGTAVGQRHGRPVVLAVDAAAMHGAGHEFYLSENNVWLTASVPAAFIQFP